MSNRQQVWEQIKKERVIAVARGDGTKNLISLTAALSNVGIRVFEFTMTTPGALDSVKQLRIALPHLLIGVGSVLNADMAQAAISAGAQFLVSPILKVDIIEAAQEADTVIIPGTFSPSEAQQAWEAGADGVKVFPASVLGPKYIASLLAPLPHLQLVPTGGINAENAPSFLKAGAVAVAVGSSLIDRESLRTGKSDAVLKRAVELVARIRCYRGIG